MGNELSSPDKQPSFVKIEVPESKTGAALNNLALRRIFNNNQLYEFIVQIEIDKVGGKEKIKIPLNPESIMELCLEDDFLDWPVKGYFTINNKHESLERILKNSDVAPLFRDEFSFRNDGRDKVRIRLRPVPEGVLNIAKDFELPDDIWTIDLKFVIYDQEDIAMPNVETKAKKFYFWDDRYHTMIERNVEWSTAIPQRPEFISKYPKSKPVAQTSDVEREMFTGDAIKDMLHATGLFEESLSDDPEEWDQGLTRVLYTAPSQYSINDNLTYLAGKHLGGTKEDKDICIFHRNRFDEDPKTNGKWTLKPLTKYFEKAGKKEPGEYQIEHLFIEEANTFSDDDGFETFDGQLKKGQTAPWKAPLANDPSDTIDIKANEYFKIQSYMFVDMAGIDNTLNLTTKPVYWYDFREKHFGTDFEENEIKKVKDDHFKKKYADKLYAAAAETPALFTLNKTKTERYSIDPKFTTVSSSSTPTVEGRILKGKGEILNSGFFLNECVMLRLLGSTHRLSGKFIAIDKFGDSDSLFDYKLLGQWFVINVKHIIQGSTYLNDVLAVKIHSYEDLGVKDDAE
jgi:hypothetical protein